MRPSALQSPLLISVSLRGASPVCWETDVAFYTLVIHSSVSALRGGVRFQGFKNPGGLGSPVKAHTCSAIAAATATDACRMSWQYQALCGLSEVSLPQELAHCAKDRGCFANIIITTSETLSTLRYKRDNSLFWPSCYTVTAGPQPLPTFCSWQLTVCTKSAPFNF